jgi:ATP-dependent helicase/nuclease subunit A
MQKGVTGTDRGNATHEFLQFCDFSKITNTATFEKERLRLVGQEFITPHQSELVDSQGIIDFITSDIMQSLVALGTCKKEDRFIFTLPASEVTDINSNEPVVIQGIIDCWFEKEGTAVIVDYKTDRGDCMDDLYKKYSKQLEMYRLAGEYLYEIKDIKCIIYSFYLGEYMEF